jgi:hypothetical protein
MRRLPGVLLVLPFAGFLILVLVSVYHRLEFVKGFDYPGHLDYVRYIDFTGWLPLADRGWQMYHPPGYYVATVLLFEGLHRLGWAGTLTDAGRWLSSGAWVAEGMLALAAVRAFGGGWIGAAGAAAVVWLLPGQSMMGAMLYNETFTGLGVGLMTLGIVLWARDDSRPGLVILGAGFLIALLSKYSGAAAAVAALPIILRVGIHQLRLTLAALAPGLLLGLGFYARNVANFSTPVPLNGELFDLKSWDPFGWGHPSGFFTSFSLDKCAAQHSFWGGLWKWFWVQDCFALQWPQTISGPLLIGAVLGTAVALAGLLWVAGRGLRDPSYLFLAAIPAVVLVAFIAYNLRITSPTADKGVYVLAGLVPVAVAVGLFIERFKRSPVPVVAYALVCGWSAVMVFASGLG